MDSLTKAMRSKNMSRIRSKDTLPERIVRNILTNLGKRYRLHVKDLAGKPDIAIKKIRVAIFINGCFWHSHKNCKRSSVPKSNRKYWLPKLKRNVQKQVIDIKSLKREDWDVLVIWECETRSKEILARRIESWLQNVSKAAKLGK